MAAMVWTKAHPWVVTEENLTDKEDITETIMDRVAANITRVLDRAQEETSRSTRPLSVDTSRLKVPVVSLNLASSLMASKSSAV